MTRSLPCDEMHEGVRAELLDHLDGPREERVGGARRREMLGADADRHRAPGLGAPDAWRTPPP